MAEWSPLFFILLGGSATLLLALVLALALPGDELPPGGRRRG